MVLTFTDEERKFLQDVERFVDDCVLPNTRAWEKDTFPPDIWKQTAKLGITHCVLPREFGGRGYSCGTYAEMCRLISPSSQAVPVHGSRVFNQRGNVGIEVFDAQTLERLPTIAAPGVYGLFPSPDGLGPKS